jgi:hypothetical protein
VILDAHSNLLAAGTVSEDFDGFYGIIDARDQYPMTTRKSVLIRPGHNNFVSMSATKISSNDINNIEPQKRNCFFPGDQTMDVHQNYTQANCMLECQLTYALGMVSQSWTYWLELVMPGIYSEVQKSCINIYFLFFQDERK